jgi:predicted aspartyl protease
MQTRVMPGAAVSIPVELTSNLVLVRASVSGSESAWFIVDTGAGASVVNAEWAERIGLEAEGEVEVSASGGSVDASQVTGADLMIAGVELHDVTLLAIPLSGLESGVGRSLGGIIGWDLFDRYVVEIDYRARALRLHGPDSYRYEGPGASLPIAIEDNTPFVSATLVGPGGQTIPSKLLIDTGNTGTITLNTPFVRRHRLVETSERVIPLVASAILAGNAQRYVGRVEELHLGSFRFPELLAILAQDEEGDFAEARNDGLIGGDLLRRFRLVVDYPHRRLILEPGEGIGRSTEFDMSGMSLGTAAPNFQTFRVRLVIPGSPAEDAGVEPGDLLLTIDGRRAAEYGLDEIRQMFRKPGERYALTLQRGESTVEVTLTTRRMV